MEKTTLNPFENAKRTAKGTGGGSVTPEQIEQLQSEIDVLGSENRTQTQDITDIKAQLTELASAYSTTEHKTGKKWLDGKDIYEKIIDYTGTMGSTATILSSGIDFISNIIDARCIADNGAEGVSPITIWLDGTDLKGRTVGNFSSQLLHIVIQYTKSTT